MVETVVEKTQITKTSIKQDITKQPAKLEELPKVVTKQDEQAVVVEKIEQKDISVIKKPVIEEIHHQKIIEVHEHPKTIVNRLEPVERVITEKPIEMVIASSPLKGPEKAILEKFDTNLTIKGKDRIQTLQEEPEVKSVKVVPIVQKIDRDIITEIREQPIVEIHEQPITKRIIEKPIVKVVSHAPIEDKPIIVEHNTIKASTITAPTQLSNTSVTTTTSTTTTSSTLAKPLTTTATTSSNKVLGHHGLATSAFHLRDRYREGSQWFWDKGLWYPLGFGLLLGMGFAYWNPYGLFDTYFWRPWTGFYRKYFNFWPLNRLFFGRPTIPVASANVSSNAPVIIVRTAPTV